ncbi:MAG: outer membrane protein assembly factor BamC [Gammaproteobacteria bacterium]|nr:outer membrane protein assembly factor BamC [Gammaproteobacteria bacterium]
MGGRRAQKVIHVTTSSRDQEDQFVTKTIVVVALALLAGGCGWFSDDRGFFVNRSDDYIDARAAPRLVIPEDLGETLEDPFPIPPVPAQENARFYPGRAPLPDAIYANDNRDAIRIQRLGERIWLVVPEAPTTVWPKIKQFLAENGVGVVSEQPGRGRITTEWLSIADESYRDVVRNLLQDVKSTAHEGERDRLLLQVEQGLRELTSEVHMRHQADAGVGSEDEVPAELDQLTSGLVEVERRLLNELGAYIAARVAEQTVSMVAQEIAGQVKSELARDEAGQPILRLFLDEERAWATLGQALDNAGIEVLETDRQSRVHHVRIPDEVLLGEEKRGFFRRLFSSRGGGNVPEVLLRLNQEEDGHYALSVWDRAGRSVPVEFAQQVLVLVREFSA